MTDETRDKQLIADIAAISNSLPQIPSSYGELRALIAALPNPTLPDVLSARSGVAESLVVSTFGAGAAASPLSSDPTTAPGAALFPQLFYGQANLLRDAELAGMTTIGIAPAVDPALATVGFLRLANADFSWSARRVQNSGTAPTFCEFVRQFDRGQPSDSPFNSKMCRLLFDCDTAAATNFDVYLQATSTTLNYDPLAPYLLAAIRLRRSATLPAGATLTIRMQIANNATGAILAESTPLDFASIDIGTARQLQAVLSAPVNAVAYRWQLKISVTKDAAVAWASVSASFGEPILALASTADMPIFAPIIGMWRPDQVVAGNDSTTGNTMLLSRQIGDTSDRFTVNSEGIIRWGAGTAAQDSRLRRTAASTLTFDDNGSGSLALLDLKGPLLRFGGTAFPAGPANNDLFFRTDLDLWFFYNGTRWLSTELFTMPTSRADAMLGSGLAATAASIVVAPCPTMDGSDIWLEDLVTQFFVSGGTALGASHKWVGAPAKRPTGNTDTSIGTINIDSGASSVIRTNTVVIDALLNGGTTHFQFACAWTKTGTPGNLSYTQYITYRIVAT